MVDKDFFEIFLLESVFFLIDGASFSLLQSCQAKNLIIVSAGDPQAKTVTPPTVENFLLM